MAGSTKTVISHTSFHGHLVGELVAALRSCLVNSQSLSDEHIHARLRYLVCEFLLFERVEERWATVAATHLRSTIALVMVEEFACCKHPQLFIDTVRRLRTTQASTTLERTCWQLFRGGRRMPIAPKLEAWFTKGGPGEFRHAEHLASPKAQLASLPAKHLLHTLLQPEDHPSVVQLVILFDHALYTDSDEACLAYLFRIVGMEEETSPSLFGSTKRATTFPAGKHTVNGTTKASFEYLVWELLVARADTTDRPFLLACFELYYLLRKRKERLLCLIHAVLLHLSADLHPPDETLLDGEDTQTNWSQALTKHTSAKWCDKEEGPLHLTRTPGTPLTVPRGWKKYFEPPQRKGKKRREHPVEVKVEAKQPRLTEDRAVPVTLGGFQVTAHQTLARIPSPRLILTLCNSLVVVAQCSSGRALSETTDTHWSPVAVDAIKHAFGMPSLDTVMWPSDTQDEWRVERSLFFHLDEAPFPEKRERGRKMVVLPPHAPHPLNHVEWLQEVCFALMWRKWIGCDPASLTDDLIWLPREQRIFVANDRGRGSTNVATWSVPPNDTIRTALRTHLKKTSVKEHMRAQLDTWRHTLLRTYDPSDALVAHLLARVPLVLASQLCQ